MLPGEAIEGPSGAIANPIPQRVVQPIDRPSARHVHPDRTTYKIASAILCRLRFSGGAPKRAPRRWPAASGSAGTANSVDVEPDEPCQHSRAQSQVTPSGDDEHPPGPTRE
jgi:hypothetical protein